MNTPIIICDDLRRDAHAKFDHIRVGMLTHLPRTSHRLGAFLRVLRGCVGDFVNDRNTYVNTCINAPAYDRGVLIRASVGL